MMGLKKNDKTIFRDFLEYLYYIRYFSDKQKRIIYENLSEYEQKILRESCEEGKWDEVFMRDVVDKMVDDIKKEYGYDLIDLRYKVLKGKSVYVPTIFWELVEERFSIYGDKYIEYVLGGVQAEVCNENKNVTLLVPKRFYSKD